MPAFFQIGLELRKSGENDEAAFIGKGIDDTKAAPLHLACQYVAGHGQRQLAIRFHIQLVIRPDKGIIRTCGDSDSDLASGPFDQRKITFQSPDKSKLVKGI